MTQKIKNDLSLLENPKKIPDYMRFFKTSKGEYGEGDKFLGIKVPDIRKIVKKYFLNLSFEDIREFLYSEYHEYRMFGLLCLVYQYKSKKFIEKQKEIFEFYIENISQINSWDLVDVTAPHIVGDFLFSRDKTILYEMAKSDNLWKKRISIVSTFYFINKNEFEDTLNLADILLDDKHDLIHKAVGWALRNVGNKHLKVEINFLASRYKKMPRTMLRYSIEKFDEELRQKYLKGLI
jgi:3-methyladenine DNA glycosylase AlkD